MIIDYVTSLHPMYMLNNSLTKSVELQVNNQCAIEKLHTSRVLAA